MKIALQQLLDHLESLRKDHPELGDADVRAALVAAVYHGFIVATPAYSLPESLAMLSPAGNAAVRIALAEFFDAAANGSARTPLQRFSAFRDPTIQSQAGHCYEHYFGYTPSIEEMAAAITRPPAVRTEALKPVIPWWQFWKRSETHVS